MDRKKMVLCLAAAVGTCSLFGCGFGGDKEEPEEPVEIVVETPTPTPAPTVADTPTPTPSPNLVDNVYTSEDKAVTLTLPDDSWTVRADEKNLVSLVSSEEGGIVILHGKGDKAMSSAVIPNTRDLAVSLEVASEMAEGTDFEIMNYSSAGIGSVDVYAYAVHYLDTAKSEGYLYAVYRYYVTATEYYSVVGNVRKEEAYEPILAAVDSFTVNSSSAISAAATGEAIVPSEDTRTMEVSQSSEDFSEEQLSNTDSTRTIYRNSDGAPIVIVPDGNGDWTDASGNYYYFTSEEDAYDQNDVDYYWHGEAGDVAFMSREQED